MKKFSISLTLILFLLGIFFGTPGFSQKEKTHPAVASSFEAQAQEMMAQKVNPSGGYSKGLTFLSTLQAGGDRLVALQNGDGGWGWPLTGASALNTLGPIAMGLGQAYLSTSDPDHLDALEDAGVLLLTKINNFSPGDGYLAAMLDQIFGGSTYRDHVNTNFYGPLAAGTYNKGGLGTFYDTEDYVNLIRTSRTGLYANIAAWDVGMGLVGAASCGPNQAEWIAGVKGEIDELDGDLYYDVVGLAGAVYGLAFVGEDYTPTAGEHLGAANLQALAVILASYQINNGGFAWNSAYVSYGTFDESIQETAYAILALSEVNRAGFYTNILGAANYIATVQNSFGGWANDQYYNEENNEVTGEALWGYTVAHTETTIETPTEVACGIYDVDITVQNFTDIGAISLALNFDPLVVGSPTVINLTSGLTSNFPSTGQVRVAYWGDPITLAPDAVLFTLRFTLLPASSGATTAFTWSTVPGECEYAGPGGTPIYVSSFFDIFWEIPVRPVKNINTGLEYCTIQAAIDDPATNNLPVDQDVITVAAGNYPENVVITKDIFLLGANASIACHCPYPNARGPESVITGSANVAVTVASDGVTINGFTITNPGGNFGIYAGGRNDLTVMDNIITGVGNTVQSAASYGVAVEMSSTADITDVIITDNCISDINGGYDPLLTGTPAKLNNGSAGGIGVGWSNANYDITYLLIENNLISDIDACINEWANGGKGAYGVIINVGAGSSYIGTAINPEVQYNTISDLEGLWAHGVGLEGETPGASVHNNDISNLTDHKTPSDAVGVQVEDNAGALTVGIHDNSFTAMSLGIQNVTAIPVNATCNWYGTTVAANVAGMIYGPVTYINWLVNGVDQQNPVCLPGFLPLANSCNGSPVVIVSALPTDNTCSTAGSILVTWTGGVANYTVAWSPPGSSTSGISVNSYTIPSLAAGTYNITVTDFYGNSAATSATVLYLPVTNVTDDPDTYYATIQAAINAADPNEEIDVCAGIYPENLLVNKAGLAIHGANFGISAGYTPGVRGPESVIVGQADVSANGVSFDGLEFDSPVAATTILVKPTLPGLSILFQNNVFDMKNQKSAAIYNDGISSTNFTILNNKFKNQFYTGTYSARVIYAKNTLCTITGNDFSNVELGVYLIGTATDATIVSANRFNVTSAAVLTGERQNIQIINNDFVSGGAIYCDKTSNLTITNNWFGTGVTYAGYFIASIGSGIEMHNNSILSAYTSGANIGKTVFNFSTTQTVNATCNWWGTTVAANIAAKILGPVTYSPWLTTGGDDAGIIGFQPTGLCDGSLMGITAVVTDESCPCSYTGAINISVTPISGTYTYLWSPGGETTEDLTGLTGGTYTVVVTDTWTNTATLTVIVGTTPDVTPPVIACPANVTVNDMCSGPVTWMPDVTFFQNYGTNAYSACQHLWQSFTATTTGVLTQVDLYPYSGSNTGPWNVTIYDGEGEAGCVLYNNPSFTPTGSPIIFPIPRNVGVYVVYGQKYTISIVGPCNAATCDVCVDLYVRYDGGAVVYTGGKYFDNMSMGNPPASCNPPTTVTFPDGLPTDKAALGATYHIDQMASPFVVTDNCKVKYVTCSPENGSTFTCGTTPVIATATDFAGLTAGCTFNVIVNAPAVVLTCPLPANEAACQTQAAIDTKFATWLGTVVASGGCGGVLTTNPVTPVAPLACGGSTTVTWTYTSSCAPLTTTCFSTFTVAAPDAVVLTCPQPANEAACQTQAAIDGKFATWLASVVASGGCNNVLSTLPVTPVAPSACGGSTIVTWTYTSSCAPVTSTCSSTFNVASPAPVVLTCPADANEVACQTQAAIDGKFATWLGTVVASGGCNGSLTNRSCYTCSSFSLRRFNDSNMDLYQQLRSADINMHCYI